MAPHPTPDAPVPALALAAAMDTDVGRQRDENQDAMGHQEVEGTHLWAVCDGMGGHAGGSTASRIGIEAILERFAAWSRTSERSLRDCLEEAIAEANARVLERARSDPRLRGMGTTCVCLAIEPDPPRAFVAHVGDSRAYLLRGKRLTRLTRDHSMVQFMLDDGLLTEEEAHGHPHANIISRSLGAKGTIDVEHHAPLEISSGDLFLLCSDGLSGPVAEREMVPLMRRDDLEAAGRELIDLANERGGEDNITVVLVRVGERPELDDDETLEIVHPPPRPSRPGKRGRPAPAQEVAQVDGFAGDEDADADDITGGPERADSRKRSKAVKAAKDAGDTEVAEGIDDSQADRSPPLWPSILLGALMGLAAFLAVYVIVGDAV